MDDYTAKYTMGYPNLLSTGVSAPTGKELRRKRRRRRMMMIWVYPQRFGSS